MRRMRQKTKKKIAMMLAVALLVGLFIVPEKMTVQAADISRVIEDEEYKSITVSVGDTGTWTPEISENGDRYYYYGDYYDDYYYYDDDDDDWDDDKTYVPQNVPVVWSYTSDNPSVFSISSGGYVQALAAGVAHVTILGMQNGEDVYRSELEVTVVDMSSVKLEESRKTLYIGSDSYNSDTVVYKLTGNTGAPLSEETSEFRYTSGNEDMYVDAELENNEIRVSCYDEGSTTLTFYINGKTFTAELSIKKISLNTNSCVMAIKETKQLKVKNKPENAKFKSSNSKIASVNAQGVIKAKKAGNVIITVQCGDAKLGCVVSVVNKKVKQALNRAIKIGKTCTYSQPKRMQKGYYDCSSLVWKSYSPEGIYFGNKTYAATSRDEARWCSKNKKMIKGGLSEKNIQKMNLRPGDLMFENSSNKDKFGSIYHVEMFAGYVFYGFDSDGKAILGTKWANRGDNNYWPIGQMMGRPVK